MVRSKKKSKEKLSPEQRAGIRLENQLCFPLYSVSRLITQAYGPFLRRMGITYPQYLVLMALWDFEDDQEVKAVRQSPSAGHGLTVGEIGERLYLDSGTLTPILQKLEARGLVKRERAKNDDRRVVSHLTAAGKGLKLDAAEMSYRMFCISQMSMEEIGALKGDIKKLMTKIQAHLS